MVREGAALITLDTLTEAESAELLATHLGTARVTAEPDATVELAELCAHLPLALRIAAANLAARPHQTIAGSVRELGGTDLLTRLHVVGDPESAVAAAFDMSYRFLPAAAQRLFRLLGLVPGPEVDREAAAILLGRDPSDPVPELDELLSAHLLFEPSPGRYRSHDLLALYARRHAGEEPAAVREGVLHRLLSWYLLGTDAATRILLNAYWTEDRSELALTGTARDFSGPDEAQTWLEAELANLTAAVTYAADHGPPPFAWHLANSLRGFLHTRGSEVELAVARAGLRAAQAANHVLGQAFCHGALGIAAVTLGELRTAMEEYESARQQYIWIQHSRGIANTSSNLGDVCIRLGDIDHAIPHIEDALKHYSTDSSTRAVSLTNLATTHRIRGNYVEALHIDSECLALAERTGSAYLIATAKIGLGMTYLNRGDPATAETLLLEAHSTFGQLGSDIDTYDTLAGLVLVCTRTGRTDEAFTRITSLNDLIDRGLYSSTGDDWAHAAILETHLAAGQVDEAIAIGTPALEQHDRDGHRLTTMRLQLLLGQAHAARGDIGATRRYWEAALACATEQALPERPRLEALLGDLAGTGAEMNSQLGN